MAEELKDPRDVPWHPRRRHTLYGHEAAEARLLKAVHSNKLHHAWLISGPRGIGKATLAYRFARYLAQPPAGRQPASLDVPRSSQTAHLLAAGAHPNIFILQRALVDKKRGGDDRTPRLKTEIAVDDSREAIEFMTRTSASGGWRIVIVDPVDELNASSANALLKMIEEPPAQSLILMVCHQPGSLLRTIRSRSIRLPLEPLSVENTLRVLDEVVDDHVADPAQRRQAAELSRGSPGRAMELLGSKGAAAFADFQARPRLTPAVCAELGLHFAGRDSADDYAVFCDLLTGWIAGRAREAGLAGHGAPLARAHDDIVYSLRQTDALNLDRRQTVVDALLRLDEALKAISLT